MQFILLNRRVANVSLC